MPKVPCTSLLVVRNLQQRRSNTAISDDPKWHFFRWIRQSLIQSINTTLNESGCVFVFGRLWNNQNLIVKYRMELSLFIKWFVNFRIEKIQAYWTAQEKCDNHDYLKTDIHVLLQFSTSRVPRRSSKTIRVTKTITYLSRCCRNPEYSGSCWLSSSNN